MFVNIQEVKDITNTDVSNDDIRVAQHIIEAFVGRNESEVTNPDDVSLMAKAVAFQAVYMLDNYDRVYQQVAVKQFAQVDGQMTVDSSMAAPFIAPLAVLTLRRLSWRRSRSVKTGGIFGGRRDRSGWDYS